MSLNDSRLIEYMHKNTTYVLPPMSTVFGTGDSFYVEYNGKRLRNLSEHETNRVIVNLRYNYKIALPITAVGSGLVDEYKPIIEYFAKFPRISFLQFDYATGNDIALCTFFKPLEFINMGNLYEEINRSMPYLVNIFRRPLIHLRQAEIIQPVDAVKRVDHNTIRHLTRHSEIWKDIDTVNDSIVPSKLLTKVYEDDYSIYENLVFRDLIDQIANFLRKRIYYITEILETFKESIQLDAVNRFNHQKYYLAIGKLYVGFYKMEDSAEIHSALENLKTMYKQINGYKSRAVYAKNHGIKKASGEVRPTNILMMHKDYRHVFALQQKFVKNTSESRELGKLDEQLQGQRGYEQFCGMLLTFAASNFNLTCTTKTFIFKDGALDADFESGDWQLTLKSEPLPLLDINIIIMTVKHKETTIRYAFIPMGYRVVDKKRTYEGIIERMFNTNNVFAKYIFLEPFDDTFHPLNGYNWSASFGGDIVFYGVLPVSITEINSFRRLQKMIFEAMVRSNTDFDICAFCGEPLEEHSDGNYLCKKCKTGIRKIDCNWCGSSFVASFIALRNVQTAKYDEQTLRAMPPFILEEKQYLFRNITDMTKSSFICPYCGSEHPR